MPPPADNLRVFIVADDPLARAGLATLLTNHPNCTVVGQIAGDVDIPATVDVYRPHVLPWDLGWNADVSLDRLAGVTEIETPVTALLADETHAPDAWAAGARSLLWRDVDPDKLVTTLQATAQGLAVFESPLAAALLPNTGILPSPPRSLKN